MHRGFIRTYRKLINWEWYQDSHMVHLLTHCIMKANRKPGVWMGETIDRGCFATGLQRLSAETGISIRSLRTCLARLEKSEISTLKTTNRLRIIRVNNYDSYQADDTRGDRQSAKPATSRRQASDKPATANDNEEKEEKVEKKNTTPIGAVLSPGFSDEFMEKVWAYYAKHKVKPYGSVGVQNIALRQLFEKCGGNEEMAKDALRETLTNTYQGFTWYFKRSQQGGTDGAQERSGGSQERQPTKADHAALMQQLVDRSEGVG